MSAGYQLAPPQKAIYGAVPVKTAPTPSTLRAYNIDLSSEVREADAYRPKQTLPVIFKPSTLERRSKSSDGLTRRRTFGAADEAKPWYSSSCDGPTVVRKPSVLHTAAPVDIDIPYIDEDPPPKPLRSLFATPVYIGEETPKNTYHSLPREGSRGLQPWKPTENMETMVRARPLQLATEAADWRKKQSWQKPKEPTDWQDGATSWQKEVPKKEERPIKSILGGSKEKKETADWQQRAPMESTEGYKWKQLPADWQQNTDWKSPSCQQPRQSTSWQEPKEETFTFQAVPAVWKEEKVADKRPGCQKEAGTFKASFWKPEEEPQKTPSWQQGQATFTVEWDTKEAPKRNNFADHKVPSVPKVEQKIPSVPSWQERFRERKRDPPTSWQEQNVAEGIKEVARMTPWTVGDNLAEQNTSCQQGTSSPMKEEPPPPPPVCQYKDLPDIQRRPKPAEDTPVRPKPVDEAPKRPIPVDEFPRRPKPAEDAPVIRAVPRVIEAPPQRDLPIVIDSRRNPGGNPAGRHLREDSGFREGPDEDEEEEDETEEDFDWGDEHLNKAARRRSSLVLRTQTSLRVKTIIDKLLSASGRDQRRALFSLKQIFQDDKDLVHEFVQDGGLDCMIRLGRVADQNHQNYILRALGQLMLYVDGMNGIIAHNATIQWLYELLDSPLFNEEEKAEMSPYRMEWFRLVVKTALKLLLVFIEYNDNNALLVLAAVTTVDRSRGEPDWTGLMKVTAEKDCPDPETIVYGLTVINKALHGIPDRDTYYDAVDSLDALGMEDVMSRLQKMGNREIAEQCRLYERELNQEDADSEEDTPQNAKMRKNGDDKRTKMRARAAEAIRQQEEQRSFGANREIFAKAEETKENRPAIEVVEKKSNLPWRNGQSEGHREQNGEAAPAAAPTTPKKIPEPLKLQPENQENEKPEEPEDHKVKAPPPLFPTIFSPTETKTMEFPDPAPPPQKEKEQDKPAPPKAKIVKDDGGGGFAAMLQKRAAKASENNQQMNFVSKESESEQQWRKAAENLKSRPLIINDLDFSEFHNPEFEQDPLVMARLAQVAQNRGGPTIGGGPPPPPPPGGIPLPPRLQGLSGGVPPPPPPPSGFGPPPPPPPGMRRESSPGPGTMSKGVLKLHWKPAAVEPPPVPSLKQKGTFWNGLDVPSFDPGKLVKLFESKQQKEVAVKKPTEAKPQTLQVLPTKRSQAINIGLTKLPPVTVIPAAIMKFDSLVLNKDGIEKILKTMMPSLQEIEEIQNKSAEHPEMVLGTAEQFLLKLSQIPCLLERLKLWIFTLDYKNIEKDIAEPLMDLQLGMKEMEESKTFKRAMALLLAIGNSLSGTEIKGFYLDYLAKASEVKDPVYKHPLTHHLAENMIEQFPEGSDLYSEFGAVSRSARIDYKEVWENLQRLEKECKASWDYLAKISKNDGSSMRQKINDYLVDVAERIHQLKDIHRIAINRWHGFLMYFGYTVQEIPDMKPNEVFKMVTEFALEYRTTRDKILQQRKRMAEKRERNKTRGKMWAVEAQEAENGGVRKKTSQPVTAEQRHDELSMILSGLSGGDGTLRRRGGRPSTDKPKASDAPMATGEGDSPDDEILNSLAKAATMPTEARENRRRARQFNRKSLRRTRTLKMVDGQIETY